MRSNRPPRGPSPTTLVLLATTLLSSHVTAITLDQFQQIAGFPGICSSAYLRPVAGCQESDFNPPNAPCSQACFNGLTSITSYINSQCKGVTADPTTLIGLFFEGKGAMALCPTVSGSNSGTIIIPPQPPNQVSNSPEQASQTFIMSSMAAAEPTNVSGGGGSSGNNGNSGNTMASPMASPTNGANSASAAVAGTQTATQPSSTNGNGNGNGDSSSFGGGAVPFGVSQSAQGVANSLSPASAMSLGGILLITLFL